MSYQPVIGLEVHVELNTKTKMFCRCSADYFDKEPNTHTCPVCLGLPGALPYINKEAIEKCMMIGLALNCSITEKSLFERKNYFYPDLPKGYQVSQYRWPICINGKLKIENGKWIRINRVHQEEDTGKLTHIGNESFIDFNRSGAPLVEIVTEPDFTDTSEVKEYAKKLQQIFRNLGVSNADMEKGDMRLEANVSVRQVQSSILRLHSGQEFKVQNDELPNYRVELKNINSFRIMEAAIKYEIERQIKALENGEKLTQETRGWSEDKKCTYLQRSKEEAHDYRYFPEPDLPELKIEETRVRSLESGLPELPESKSKRFEKELGVKLSDAKILAEEKNLADYFEKAVQIAQGKVSAQQIANYIINKKPDINVISPDRIVKDILSRASGAISDTTELEKVCQEVISENTKIVDDYKRSLLPPGDGSKSNNILNALIGQVMRKTQGKADVNKVKELLERYLKP